MWGCFQEKPEKSGFSLRDLDSTWSFFERRSEKLNEWIDIEPWTRLRCLSVMARRRGEMLGEMVSIS